METENKNEQLSTSKLEQEVQVVVVDEQHQILNASNSEHNEQNQKGQLKQVNQNEQLSQVNQNEQSSTSKSEQDAKVLEANKQNQEEHLDQVNQKEQSDQVNQKEQLSTSELEQVVKTNEQNQEEEKIQSNIDEIHDEKKSTCNLFVSCCISDKTPEMPKRTTTKELYVEKETTQEVKEVKQVKQVIVPAIETVEQVKENQITDVKKKKTKCSLFSCCCKNTEQQVEGEFTNPTQNVVKTGLQVQLKTDEPKVQTQQSEVKEEEVKQIEKADSQIRKLQESEKQANSIKELLNNYQKKGENSQSEMSVQ